MRVGTYKNIPIYLDKSLVIFVSVFTLITTMMHGPPAGLIAFCALCAVYLFVFLHELGHADAARFVGLSCNSVTMFFMGGVAHIELDETDPIKELIVVGGGPFINLLLSIIAFPFCIITYDYNIHVSYAFFWCIKVNMVLAIFNLIPAFPLDGGRIFRSLLTLLLKGDTVLSTKITGFTACAMSMLFMYITFTTGNIMMLFIAIFVPLLSYAEYRRILAKNTIQIPDDEIY